MQIEMVIWNPQVQDFETTNLPPFFHIEVINLLLKYKTVNLTLNGELF